jgi:hemolysin activation/secretion protein
MALASLAQLAFSQNPLELENESIRQFSQDQERQSFQRQQLQPKPDVRLPAVEEVFKTLAFPKQESPCFVINALDFGVKSQPPWWLVLDSTTKTA